MNLWRKTKMPPKKNDPAPAAAVQVLNDALRADPDGVNALMLHQVPCNEDLAGHSAIQVRMCAPDEPSPDGPYHISPLGLVNGLFGLGWGYIVADLEDGRITGFRIDAGKSTAPAPADTVVPDPPADTSEGVPRETSEPVE